MKKTALKGKLEKSTIFENKIVTELWTVEDVANHLKVSTKTIYNWVYQRKLSPIKLGNKVLRFKEKDIRQWVTSKQKGVNHGNYKD